MAESTPVQLFLEVEMTEADADELDQLTRQLLREIEEIEVESAQLAASNTIPKGAKGDPVTIGAILVAVLPAVMPKLVEIVGAWTQRDKGRTVKYKGHFGDTTFEFEGSSADLQKLLKSMSQTGGVPHSPEA